MDKVKGTKITSKLAYVRDVHGEEMERAVLAALSEEERRQVEGAIDIGWYPIEVYESVVRALVDTVAGGDERELDRAGAYAAERQAGGAYSVYFRDKGPWTVLESMAPMHAMLNRPGEMKVERRAEGHATLLVSAPHGHGQTCRLARAFYRRAVEMCGGREVTVREVECSGLDAPACRFEVRWS